MAITNQKPRSQPFSAAFVAAFIIVATPGCGAVDQPDEASAAPERGDNQDAPSPAPSGAAAPSLDALSDALDALSQEPTGRDGASLAALALKPSPAPGSASPADIALARRRGDALRAAETAGSAYDDRRRRAFRDFEEIARQERDLARRREALEAGLARAADLGGAPKALNRRREALAAEALAIAQVRTTFERADLADLRGARVTFSDRLKAIEEIDARIETAPPAAESPDEVTVADAADGAPGADPRARPAPQGPQARRLASLVADVEFGAFHAILIGNANYNDPGWPDLGTPIRDVARIGEILEDKYGFDAKILRDATRDEILETIEATQRRLEEEDNLLIYFAGHGRYNDKSGQGYWEPVDSIADGGYRNSISASEINAALAVSDVRKVLIVADSCFSGALARGAPNSDKMNADDAARTEFLARMVAKRSRVALTSGDLSPVSDGDGGGHSLFARAFINALVDNDEVALAQGLSLTVRERVVGVAKRRRQQEPQYLQLGRSGHDGGDFVFVPIGLIAESGAP
ncbi:MAG: caspase family protein [Pseudomonadota bacterium]